MGGQSGSSLVEVLVALFLISIIMLATAPMFVYASKVNASGADLGSEGAIAVEQMELLRAANFTSIQVGGSLTSNLPGYYDLSHEGFEVRWKISAGAAPPGSKTIDVRAVSLRQTMGRTKEVTLSTLRSK